LKNNLICTLPNELAAKQCGLFPEAGSQQTYKRYRLKKESTSKSRTAAASGTLVAIL
jgi:hypothetical protein